MALVVVVAVCRVHKKKKNKGGEEKYLKKFLLKYLIFSSTNTTPQHTHPPIHTDTVHIRFSYKVI